MTPTRSLATRGNDTLYLNGLDYADGDAGADTYWVTGGSNSIQDNGPDAGVDVVKAFTSVSMQLLRSARPALWQCVGVWH